MAERRPTMMDPPVEVLLEHVDSKFTLVSLAAKRGRQVISYFNQLGEGLGSIVPPQVASLSRKPLSIALEEVAEGKITFHRTAEAEEADAAAAPEPGAPEPGAPEPGGPEPGGPEPGGPEARSSEARSPEVGSSEVAGIEPGGIGLGLVAAGDLDGDGIEEDGAQPPE